MSENLMTNNSDPGPVTLLSMTRQPAGKQASKAFPRLDGQHIKAILKGKIKVTKFNSENYQN